jgi:hypothetical protein
MEISFFSYQIWRKHFIGLRHFYVINFFPADGGDGDADASPSPHFVNKSVSAVPVYIYPNWDFWFENMPSGNGQKVHNIQPVSKVVGTLTSDSFTAVPKSKYNGFNRISYI